MQPRTPAKDAAARGSSRWRPYPFPTKIKENIPVKKNTAALTLGAMALLTTPALAGEGWIADFDEAVKVAKAENKDLLVDFTGSDWCGWCIKLDKEVFSHEAFDLGVKSNYVLVSLDFPRKEENKAKVPDIERNKELQSKYGVRGFPTILLMNTDGVVYGKTGYQPGGPEKYVEHINQLREKGRGPLMKVEKTMLAYEAASGDAKTAALGELLGVMIELDFDSALADRLVDPARTALTLDPENAAGLKLRAVHALSNAGVHDAELLALARELDPKNTLGAYELQVHAMFNGVKDEATALAAVAELDALNQHDFQDKPTGFLLNFTAANWAAGPMSNPEMAKKYAMIAKGIGSDDAKRMEFINDLVEESPTPPPVDK